MFASHPSLWVNLLCIGVGAVLGAWMRWGLSLWLNVSPDRFATGTWLANLVGAYLIGVCLAYAATHPHWPTPLRLMMVTGFLGALTTFSTFSAETFTYLQAARFGLAFVYVVMTVIGSLAMTALGWISLQWLRSL